MDKCDLDSQRGAIDGPTSPSRLPGKPPAACSDTDWIAVEARRLEVERLYRSARPSSRPPLGVIAAKVTDCAGQFGVEKACRIWSCRPSFISKCRRVARCGPVGQQAARQGMAEDLDALYDLCKVERLDTGAAQALLDEARASNKPLSRKRVRQRLEGLRRRQRRTAAPSATAASAWDAWPEALRMGLTVERGRLETVAHEARDRLAGASVAARRLGLDVVQHEAALATALEVVIRPLLDAAGSGPARRVLRELQRALDDADMA